MLLSFKANPEVAHALNLISKICVNWMAAFAPKDEPAARRSHNIKLLGNWDRFARWAH